MVTSAGVAEVSETPGVGLIGSEQAAKLIVSKAGNQRENKDRRFIVPPVRNIQILSAINPFPKTLATEDRSSECFRNFGYP
jgi:hypothetical protein